MVLAFLTAALHLLDQDLYPDYHMIASDSRFTCSFASLKYFFCSHGKLGLLREVALYFECITILLLRFPCAYRHVGVSKNQRRS